MFITEILSKSWEKTKKNFWFFAVILVLYFGIIIFITVILNIIKRKFGLGSDTEFIIQMVQIIIQCWLSIGLIIVTLKIVNNDSYSISDLFQGGQYLASYLGATLLYFFILIAGIILLVIPGVIWGIRFSFYPYFIIDKKMKAIDALKESSKVTNGIKWDLFAIDIILNIIGLLGIFALGIGLFWAFPVICIASALLYYKIRDRIK